ncbi:uncharacterized protein LOC123508781 [Portunus trituberculatus]|uniref:uncharacterized protein LOC123508781 n=1 Tax=Portunus trituberculatus TaxID=210409 RepID=UPI001E1CF33A|nr:uncharacterized protein LOC123508781 [Portunus trituberculatus]
MLDNLKWDTLQTRRTPHQAEMFFKVHRGLVSIHLPQDITRTTRTLNRKYNQEEQHTYSHPSTRVDCYLYSMFPRAVQVWYRLPEEAATTSNTHSILEDSTSSHPTDAATTHPQVPVETWCTNACIPGQRTPLFGITRLKTLHSHRSCFGIDTKT